MILRQIELYLRRSGMSATTFGRQVARDPRLVHDLRRGRELGQRLRQRVRAFIEDGR